MMNKVLLIGRLARDPSLKEFQNGGAIANLRIMTNRAWRDKATGEMREKADGHTVVVHSETVARRLVEALRKGHMVYVEGMLENRQWQGNDGQTRYATEVVVRPYMGTVRKVPGTALQDHAPAMTAPATADSTTPDPHDAAPENTAVATEAEEIDFFADAGMSETSTFEF